MYLRISSTHQVLIQFGMVLHHCQVLHQQLQYMIW